MTKSAIYSSILERIGWFETDQTKLSSVDYAYSKQPYFLNRNTIIGYFPGCFAHFHGGHKDVIESFIKEHGKTENWIIVISPANTDYTFKKYGDVVEASNKYRFDAIKEYIDKHKYSDHFVIDLNPMLNYKQDQNFTDLMQDFLIRNNQTFESLSVPMYLLAGKDRHNFSKIETLSDGLIRVFYKAGNSNLSSSNIGFTKREKKSCILRHKRYAEEQLFRRYFKDQYSEIISKPIEEEFNRLYEYRDNEKVITVCKDYKDIFPYIPLHRKWVNPLLHNGFDTHGSFHGKIVIDSDMYSGSTRTFLLKNGAEEFHFVIQSVDTETTEIVDFDDFREYTFQYPFTDISSRCSMQPFTKEFHETFQYFLKEVQNV